MSDPTDLPLFANDGNDDADRASATGSPGNGSAARRLAGAIPGLAAPGSAGTAVNGDGGGDELELDNTRPLLRLASIDVASADPAAVRQIQGLVSTQLTRRDGDRRRTLDAEGHTARTVVRDEITA